MRVQQSVEVSYLPAPPPRPLPVMIFLMVDTDWYGDEPTTPTQSISTALDPIPPYLHHYCPRPSVPAFPRTGVIPSHKC